MHHELKVVHPVYEEEGGERVVHATTVCRFGSKETAGPGFWLSSNPIIKRMKFMGDRPCISITPRCHTNDAYASNLSQSSGCISLL